MKFLATVLLLIITQPFLAQTQGYNVSLYSYQVIKDSCVEITYEVLNNTADTLRLGRIGYDNSEEVFYIHHSDTKNEKVDLNMHSYFRANYVGNNENVIPYSELLIPPSSTSELRIILLFDDELGAKFSKVYDFYIVLLHERKEVESLFDLDKKNLVTNDKKFMKMHSKLEVKLKGDKFCLEYQNFEN